MTYEIGTHSHPRPMTAHDDETNAIVAGGAALSVAVYNGPARAMPGAVEAMPTMSREACHGARYEKRPAPRGTDLRWTF